MYFCEFREEYLPAVADLEKKVYPTELMLGLQEWKEEINKADMRIYAVAGFSKEELVCDIAACRMEKRNYIYIFDLNCRNPAHLKRKAIEKLYL